MKPDHYKTNTDYDVIDFCNDYKLNFNRGSAVKYVARAGKKDDEIKDLKKAIDFIQREIKFLEQPSEYCVLHRTDFNGKCFSCGEQVFTRDENL